MSSTAHFLATDERGGLIDHVRPESLRPFLTERADGRAGTVEVRAVDVRFDDGRRLTGSARATPGPDGAWTVSIGTGEPKRTGGDAPAGERVEARAPNTDAAYDLVRSWAADDGWWTEAFSWHPAS